MSTTRFEAAESLQTSLRALYGAHGYTRYKMNKFEEYDLYAKNKDFLVSERVITFTDGNGKLLALKPDVTLSIVKNSRDGQGSTEKLYYTENVYRAAYGAPDFKEIMQIGLECIGRVDAFCLNEVIRLASGSLRTVDADSVLVLSHLGVLSEYVSTLGIPDGEVADLFRLIGEKNRHELRARLSSSGIDGDAISDFLALLDVTGTVSETRDALLKMLRGKVSESTLSDFFTVLDSLANEENLVFDFSVVDDVHYYNGFVFKGFVRGLPAAVLSGGQYDKLMRRMKRSSSAVGFAVYLDALDQMNKARPEFDVDVFLLYDKNAPIGNIAVAAEALIAKGESVLTGCVMPEGLRARRTLTVNEKGEVEA